MANTRILIADDHDIIRSGMSRLINTLADMTVVGQASDGKMAIRQVRQSQPDMILMDIQMPNIDGITATHLILDEFPAIKIIILTLFDDDDLVFEAIRAGAKGYLLKDANQSDIIRAIHAVKNGEAYFGAPIAARILTHFQEEQTPSSVEQKQATDQSSDDKLQNLTPREHEILQWIARGYSNAQIDEALKISSHTLRNHISSIFSKLQVTDRTQAIIRAREAGLHES